MASADKTHQALRMAIAEPWLGLVMAGQKTVEGRIGPAGAECPWKVEDVLAVGASKRPGTLFKYFKVTAVRHYETLAGFLKAEWEKAAPHCATPDAALRAYLEVWAPKPDPEAPEGPPVLTRIFSAARVAAGGGMCAVELEAL